MKTLNLSISSKNKKSLNNFCNVFYNFLFNINNIFIVKKSQKPVKKTIITILKSPHVNKKAQEQFEIIYVLKQLQISTTHLFKFLVFLKKLKNFLSPDINIKIKIIKNIKKTNFLNKKIFNIDYFIYNKLFSIEKYNNTQIYKKNKKKVLNVIINNNLLFIDSNKLLKLFDIYGKY